MAAVEWETLKRVDWFNNRRLLEPIGYIPPAEAGERYYAQFNALGVPSRMITLTLVVLHFSWHVRFLGMFGTRTKDANFSA